ncbi:MAG: DUF3570 domain-containing protein [Myxococcota bacterium]
MKRSIIGPLLLLATTGVAEAQTPSLGERLDFQGPRKNKIALDVYAFGQGDPGDGTAGNQFRSESFQYGGIGLDIDLASGEHAQIRLNGVLSYIENDFENPLPAGSTVASATPNVITLDSSITVSLNPGGGPWTWSPGFFYHHQDGFVSVGPNFDVVRELAHGNASVFANTSFRFSWPWWANFDNQPSDRPEQYTATAMLGWSQFWSKSWLTTMSIQAARQWGRLYNTLQYVGGMEEQLSDPRLAPDVQLVQERLPDDRSRLQANLRVRYSPNVGIGLGADFSGYIDDWSIQHFSLQPQAQFSLFQKGEASIRLWYRFSWQDGTRFFIDGQEAAELFRRVDVQRARLPEGVFATQDSDLATFTTHSPGIQLRFPVRTAARLAWAVRASVYGFARSDGLFAGGANTGVETAW